MSCTTIPFDREVTSVSHATNADHATSADSATTAASATTAESADYASSAGKAQYIYPDAFEIDSFNSSKASISINSDVSADVTKSGYTPLGIVGTEGQSGFNSFVHIHNAYIKKTGYSPNDRWTAYATLVSDGTTTHTDQGIVFYVLYVKNPD